MNDGERLRDGEGVGRGAGAEQRKELHWVSCTRLTAMQRTLLWQLLEMFPHSCQLPPS